MAGYIGNKAVNLSTSGADISGTANLDVVDIDGAVDMASTLAVAGVVTANAGVVVDNITIDGTEIDLSSGDLTIDVAGDIILDADGAEIILKDAGTRFGTLFKTGNDFGIKSNVADGDLLFKGEDNTTSITALTLDMSEAGRATFNDVVRIPTNLEHAGDADTFFGFPGANNFVITAGNVSRVYGSASETVINEDSANLDFRVESDTNTHALFVDAGNGRIGINDSDPHTDLHIGGGGNIRSDVVGGKIGWGSGGGSPWYSYIASSNDGSQNVGLEFYTTTNAGVANINHLHMHPDNGTIFNEAGANLDFRVASADNGHAFFVDASANQVMFGKASASPTTNGIYMAGVIADAGTHFHMFAAHTSTDSGDAIFYLNRQSSDGALIQFRQENTNEGDISVSGSTVSYNGFSGRHESSGIPANTPVGTVVSTIDALDVYPATQAGSEGGVEPNPKAGQTRADHAQVEVSTSEGDSCVYGVVSEFDSGKLIVTSVGIGSVRVTGACAKGDLLESNGDGTAKVQSDDIIRSKTIGKVTIGNSNTGVKLVACVMYCG